MLAEDGITIASYMVGMDGAGGALSMRTLSKWAVTAQDRFVESMTAIKSEPAPAPPRRPASAPSPDHLTAAQTVQSPRRTAQSAVPAIPKPVETLPAPAQENTVAALPSLPSLPSPPPPQGYAMPVQLSASPASARRVEQMGAAEVSAKLRQRHPGDWNVAALSSCAYGCRWPPGYAASILGSTLRAWRRARSTGARCSTSSRCLAACCWSDSWLFRC